MRSLSSFSEFSSVAPAALPLSPTDAISSFIHSAGETLGDGDAIDDNLFDAILLVSLLVQVSLFVPSLTPLFSSLPGNETNRAWLLAGEASSSHAALSREEDRHRSLPDLVSRTIPPLCLVADLPFTRSFRRSEILVSPDFLSFVIWMS